MSSEIKVNTISEYTSANGVTIDGVVVKDNAIARTYLTDPGKILQVVSATNSTEQSSIQKATIVSVVLETSGEKGQTHINVFYDSLKQYLASNN